MNSSQKDACKKDLSKDERLLKAIETNIQLRRLYDQHKRLEEKLSAFENRSYLSPQEGLQEKAMKMEKLETKEQIFKLLDAYAPEAGDRESASPV